MRRALATLVTVKDSSPVRSGPVQSMAAASRRAQRHTRPAACSAGDQLPRSTSHGISVGGGPAKGELNERYSQSLLFHQSE